MAQQIGLHPNTFIKYFKEAQDLGYIVPCKNGYKVIKLREIISEYCGQTSTLFGKHGILRSKNCKFKEVLSELEYALIADNVVENQLHVIKKKEKKIELFRKLKKTGKNSAFNVPRKDAKRLIKELGSIAGVSDIYKRLDYNSEQVTSCRHTAFKIGVSKSKANKLLNTHPVYKRKVHAIWYDGTSLALFDTLKEIYPKATIYPLVSLGKTKVSFGSTLEKRI